MSVRGRSGGDAVLVAALAAGATYPEAAQQAGVSERTVRRRLEDPAFTAQVAAARGELIGLAVGHLADTASEAAQTLRELLSARSETVRLGAARSVLELVIKLRELTELQDDVTQLKEQVARFAEAMNAGQA